MEDTFTALVKNLDPRLRSSLSAYPICMTSPMLTVRANENVFDANFSLGTSS
jgi:hypothetical protein